MKILRLRFKNINSLKGVHFIDFTAPPLADTGIYAIIGPTGSGKSTILDAITLALYNQTPRTGRITQGTMQIHGSIITRRAHDSFSEVEYEVNGHHYRSKWSVHRAKRSGMLQDYHMELASLTNDKLFDVSRSKVPDKNTEIIGLDYEQFVKSILLSQGEFARFLKANASERGDLLEKITGTVIYRRIGQLAFERQKTENQKLNDLTLQQQSIHLISDDEILKMQNKQQLFEKQVVEDEKALEKSRQLLQIKEEKQKIAGEIRKQENILDNLQKQQTDFQSEIQKLERHKQLYALKTDITDWINKNKQFDTIQLKIKDLRNKEKRFSEKAQQLGLRLEQLRAEKKEVEKEFELTKPILVKVRALDNQLLNTQQLVDAENKRLAAKEAEVKTASLQIQKAEKKLQDLQVKKEKENNWLSNNAILEDLQVDYALLTEKVENYEAEKYSSRNALKTISKIRMYDEVKSVKLWKDKYAVIEQYMSAAKGEMENLEAQLSYTKDDLPGLSEKIEQLRDDFRNASQLLDLAKNYEKELEYSDELSGLITENEEVVNTTASKIQKLKDEKEIETKQIEELSARYERQQLEAKYKEDRLKLRVNEPCFLCGSTHHPYVENYESQLSSTEKDLKQSKRTLEDISKQISEKEKVVAKAEAALESYREQLKNKKTDLQKLSDNFMQINKDNTWQHAISDQQKIIKHADEIRANGEQLKKEKNQLDELIKLRYENQQLEYVLEKIQDYLSVEKDMKKYYGKYKNIAQKVASTAEFLSVLEKSEKNYRAKKEETQQLKQEIATQQEVLKEKNNSFEYIENQKNEIYTLAKTKHDELKKLKAERQLLLNGQAATDVEEEFRERIENLNDSIASLEKETAQNTANIQNTTERLQENESQCADLEKEKQAQEELLLPRLQKIGYDSIAKAATGFLSENQVKTIENRKEELQKKRISAEQTLTDKQQLLETIKAKDKAELTLENLKQNIEKQQNMLQTANREIGILKNKHDENKRRKKDWDNLQQAIEKQKKETQRWNELNHLIGDAQGKRFSQFAQELTLLQLITLANKHLKNLDNRYIIKKNSTDNKDSLVVVDTFQADEERSVKTLSGGESFLVSLSLALGLSDLAGTNTKIESLFIDEGFGSLDQQTLDTALSALERLQMESNRTIGLISHVDSLKERIRTQIELNKSSFGYSTITIKNA